MERLGTEHIRQFQVHLFEECKLKPGTVRETLAFGVISRQGAWVCAVFLSEAKADRLNNDSACPCFGRRYDGEDLREMANTAQGSFSPARQFDPHAKARLARWPIPGRLSQCLLLPVHVWLTAALRDSRSLETAEARRIP